ncbi:hypothetical protein F0225_11550 [Vibrio pectenicida]|uniref:Uncharacterized protein n=1 Tax=Vibrio pectenicida TaxID=62763 RepID=A0A7Y3ZZJ9_9VIBR|nr:hypothetical protein [Vibrio pectenicida]NOH71966.1 hypothetical protein [Vibrio pectenicida]
MELFIQALLDDKYWVAVTIAVVSILLNIQKVTEYYFYLRKNRQAQILTVLQEPLVSAELKAHLKNELDIECFKSVHGVRLSTPMLNAVFVLNQRLGDSVAFRHVLRAFKNTPDISGIEQYSFRIKVSLFETLMKLYNLIAGALIAAFGFLGFMLSIHIIITGGELRTYMTGILLIPIGAFMFDDGVAFISVRHINAALEDYELTTLENPK